MRSMIPVLEEMEISVNSSSDLETVRDGMPSGMLLIEGIIRKLPHNRRARLLATKLYSGYALAFVEEGNPERAHGLYLKARDHGLAALPGGEAMLNAQFREAENAIGRLKKDQVPLLFWAAQAWAGAIVLAIDNPRNQAALARVEAMMARALTLNESFYYGGPRLFRGALLGSKPPPAGGDPELALQEMNRAFHLSGGHSLLCQYYRARLLASMPGREGEAAETIRMILDDRSRHPEELTFLNTVTVIKARKLLSMMKEEESWLFD